MTLNGRDAVLSGLVATPEMKEEVGQRVAKVFGVRSVMNRLQVTASRVQVYPALKYSGLQEDLTGLLSIQSIDFEVGNASLTRQGRELLNEIASILSRYPDASIEIAGHTDTSGQASANRELSQRRAQTVLNHLVAEGIDESRLSAVGYGGDRPVADNASADGRSRNRRVEFLVK